MIATPYEIPYLYLYLYLYLYHPIRDSLYFEEAKTRHTPCLKEEACLDALVAKTPEMQYLHRLFSAKEPCNYRAAKTQERPCSKEDASRGEVGGWGRVPFSRNLMSPTPRRKWYLTTGRRAH